MGYRPNRANPRTHRQVRQCRHQPVEVDNDQMPERRWLCSRCLQRITPRIPPGGSLEKATWVRWEWD